MKATQKLHELGQSVWLDNITRDLLTSGTFRRYIAALIKANEPQFPDYFRSGPRWVHGKRRATLSRLASDRHRRHSVT
jgi:hypothetical protein